MCCVVLLQVNRDTRIVSRPNSIYSANDSRSRTSSLANIFSNRRASQTGPHKPRGSIVPALPPQVCNQPKYVAIQLHQLSVFSFVHLVPMDKTETIIVVSICISGLV